MQTDADADIPACTLQEENQPTLSSSSASSLCSDNDGKQDANLDELTRSLIDLSQLLKSNDEANYKIAKTNFLNYRDFEMKGYPTHPRDRDSFGRDDMYAKICICVACRHGLQHPDVVMVPPKKELRPPVGGLIRTSVGDSSRRKIVSIGWNGYAPDQEASTHDSKSLHAEENAILFANEQASGGVLYTTLFPCTNCAKLICQAQISKVLYLFIDTHSIESVPIFDAARIFYEPIVHRPFLYEQCGTIEKDYMRKMLQRERSSWLDGKFQQKYFVSNRAAQYPNSERNGWAANKILTIPFGGDLTLHAANLVYKVLQSNHGFSLEDAARALWQIRDSDEAASFLDYSNDDIPRAFDYLRRRQAATVNATPEITELLAISYTRSQNDQKIFSYFHLEVPSKRV